MMFTHFVTVRKFTWQSFRMLGLILGLMVWMILVGDQTSLGHAQLAVFAAEPTGWAYSTYLGGNSTDVVKGITVDATGNFYVIGETGTDDFLGSGHTVSGYSDIFVAKFNPSGTQLLALTLLGSTDSDYPLAIQVDGEGNVYATAMVLTDDFPTQNALWTTPPNYWENGVLFKLNASGDLVYSTYLPLDVFDATQNLAVDSAGNAYVVGTSFFGETGNQIGLLKISSNGTQLMMEKHTGGEDSEKGTAIALDSAGNIYLTGTTEGGESFPVTANAHQPVCGDMFYGDNWYCYQDGVVVVMNTTGQVTYSSHHGGSFTDEPQAIGTDGQGNIVLAGNTTSGVFPLAQALQSTCPLDDTMTDCSSPRGFVSLIHVTNGVGTLTYSTYLGSPESESTNVVMAATMNSSGQATVTGYTNGHAFPLANPVQDQLSDSFCTTFGSDRYCFDAFVVTFTPTGGLAFGTYLGATFDEFPYGITQDEEGSLYVTGLTEADDFPTTADAYQPANLLGDDGFIVKIGGGEIPPPPAGDHFVFLPLITR